MKLNSHALKQRRTKRNEKPRLQKLSQSIILLVSFDAWKEKSKSSHMFNSRFTLHYKSCNALIPNLQGSNPVALWPNPKFHYGHCNSELAFKRNKHSDGCPWSQLEMTTWCVSDLILHNIGSLSSPSQSDHPTNSVQSMSSFNNRIH